MLFAEAVEKQVLDPLGLERSSLVLFREICGSLDRLYAFLLNPQLLFIKSELTEERYISAQDRLIRVQMQNELWQLVETLNKHGQVQFGIAGKYNLYFSLRNEERIIFSTRENKLYGEPIQSNAIIYSEYQNAFYFLEQFGEVTEVITNQQTGAITFFLKSGSECCIFPSDPYFKEIQAIVSGKMVQIGSIMSDRLFYFPAIGFYNGETGKVVKDLHGEAVRVDESAHDAINLFLAAKRITYEITDAGDSEVFIDLGGKVVKINAKDKRNYVLQQMVSADAPIQVGSCAGTDGIYYLWGTGVLSKRAHNHDFRLYYDVQSVCESTKFLIPGTHLYVDPKHPSHIYVASPGMRIHKCTSNDKYFHVLQELLLGKVGIIRDSNGNGAVRFLIFLDEEGIVYQPFESSAGDAEDQIVAEKGAFQVPHFTPAKSETNIPIGSKGPTRKEKKRKEQRKTAHRRH